MAREGKFQVVELVHAMYDTLPDSDLWMSDVATRLYDFVGIGEGCIAYRFDHREGASVTSKVQVVDGPDDWRRLPDAFIAAATPAFRRKMHSQVDPLTAREIFSPSMWDALAPPSAPDGISLQCTSPGAETAQGVQFFAASPETVILEERRRELLRHLMSHWVSANRLRFRLGSGGAAIDSGVAIVDTTHRVVHATEPFEEKSGLERLRALAKQADGARATAVSTGASSDGADLSAWTALTDGQWSLVDHFDSDGRRFLVVLDNAPQVSDPRALDEREEVIAAYACLGYANKAIAYHLGVNTSSVSRGLQSVMRKLGVSSREGLIATYSRVLDPPSQAVG